jgi:transposase-like protein
MDQRIRRFRTACRREERGRGRYPAGARDAAVAYGRARERDGATVHRAARELGIPMQTLQAWMRAAAPAFRRVTVEAPDASAPPRLVVRTPSGLIVEGLDVAGVAELSRALAPR